MYSSKIESACYYTQMTATTVTTLVPYYYIGNTVVVNGTICGYRLWLRQTNNCPTRVEGTSLPITMVCVTSEDTVEVATSSVLGIVPGVSSACNSLC